MSDSLLTRFPDKPRRKSVAAVIRRADGRVLLLQRGETAPHYPLHWGPVTGFIEVRGDTPEDAAQTAIREAQEELSADVRVLREGAPFWVDVGRLLVHVHPVLCALRDPEAPLKLNYENARCEWVTVRDALGRQTIPRLDEDFRRLGLLDGEAK